MTTPFTPTRVEMMPPPPPPPVGDLVFTADEVIQDLDYRLASAERENNA